MRENTRCEVEEPMSTPTLRMTISSSSTSERPVLEKKIRPLGACSVIGGRHPSRAREFRNDGALLVEIGLHPARHSLCLELRLVFRADEGIFHPVRDRGAAFGNVHGGIVRMLLSRRSRLAAGTVRSKPGRQPQRILRGAEMLVIPARAARRRRYHSHRLVVDALDLVSVSILPRSDAVSFRPGVGIALACEADQH